MSHIRNHSAYHAAVARNARRTFSSKPFKKFAKLQTKRFVRGATKFVNSGAATREAGRYGGPEARLVARAITGHGDYKIHHGRGFASKSSHRASHHRGSAMSKGMMRVEHSEYIGDLISSAIITGTTPNVAPWTSQSYQIQPGNSGTFPWLSSIAINFQNWAPHKIVFEYKPLVSDSATSTTSGALTSMGTCLLATQYDVVQGPYPNKNLAENSDFAVSSKASHSMRMAIECKKGLNPLNEYFINGAILDTTTPLIGTNSNPANTDIRFQDIGLFQAASVNIPVISTGSSPNVIYTPVALGELWVHYDITLSKPQLNGGLTNVLSAHYRSPSSSATAPLGTLGTLVPDAGGSYMKLVNITANSFSFPLAITEGQFLVCLYGVGSSAANIALPLATVVNGSITRMWNNDLDTVANAPNTTAGGASNWILCLVVAVNAPGATLCALSFANTASLPSGYLDVVVTPYNINMN